MLKRLANIVVLSLALFMVSACDWWNGGEEKDVPVEDVMIVYSVGRNSLKDDLLMDIEDLANAYVPGKNSGKALVVITHSSQSASSFKTETNPYVIRFYTDSRSRVVRDTLKTYGTDFLLTKSENMKEVLTYVQSQFKASHYGMVFSSHGWGWLPKGYYQHGENTDKVRSARSAYRYVAPDRSRPKVKSVGQENVFEDGTTYSYELNISDFVAAIPMHLDYMIFDACLMGGIETAYEFKDICDYFVGSQAEILSQGFDYENITSRLLEGDKPDVQAVCADYFALYKDQTGWQKSATISMVDCKELKAFADVCKGLIDKYRARIAVVNPARVQRYYTYNKHWFYDLESIFMAAGISDDDRAVLEAALDKCVVYKAATDYILDSIPVETFSGFSMYLPSDGSMYLNSFYKTLKWNEAVELVK